MVLLLIIGLVWGYNLVWMPGLDALKIGVYRTMAYGARHHRLLVSLANRPFHSHPS